MRYTVPMITLPVTVLGMAWLALSYSTDDEQPVRKESDSATRQTSVREPPVFVRPREVNNEPEVRKKHEDLSVGAEESEPLPEEVSDPSGAPPTVEEQAVLMQNAFHEERGARELVDVESNVTRLIETLRVDGARLERVECRRTMCRVALNLTDDAAEGAFFKALLAPEVPSPDSAVIEKFNLLIPERHANDDGSSSVTAYLTAG